MSTPDTVRLPSVAGTFYPGFPERLSAAVARYLRVSERAPLPEHVCALIAPHAGYAYSGATAGKVYALLGDADWVDRVVVLAPSHRCRLRGIAVPEYGAYRTPLGDIRVDTGLCRKLTDASPLVAARKDAHDHEHAIEVQLPFIQTVCPSALLVPVVCGHLGDDDPDSLADALARVVPGEGTLWVVSSDFTHYGPAFDYVPFRDDAALRVEQLDLGAVDAVLHRDWRALRDYVATTGATICGASPIELLLALRERIGSAWRGRLVDYTTSARTDPGDANSVSYAAIAFSTDHEPDEPGRAGLGDDERRLLLSLARATVSADILGTDFEPPVEVEVHPRLTALGACFVTLHLGGDLRGCIGSLEPALPLYRDVIANARDAAFRDPRFMPLGAPELRDVRFEISVLSQARPVAHPEDIELGRHGIILQKRANRAVYLPQVPGEQGWDLTTTLSHLCVKAGLRPDAWRRGVELEVFEAEVFGEEG